MSETLFADHDFGGVPFRVAYDGPNHQGEMSARQLSEVLAAMSDFAEGVARAASGEESARAVVKVQAAKTGSFDIVAILIANWPILVTVASGGGFGFQFWWKHMRKVVVQHEELDEGFVKVTMQSGEVMIWTAAQWRVWNNKRVRRALGRLMEPLTQDATAATLSIGDEEPVRVDQTSADRLRPEIAFENKESRSTVHATPDVVSLQGGDTKWRWISGDSTFKAKMADKEFLNGMHSGQISLGPNDHFRLAVHREWVEDLDGEIRNEQITIDKVLEYKPGAIQDVLPQRTEGLDD